MKKAALQQVALTFIVTCWVLPQPGRAARPSLGAVGVNLSAVYSAGEQIPFVDVFKMSAPWTLHPDTRPSQPHSAVLDANGWVAKLEPGEYAETSIFTGSGGHYPAGRYTIVYQGKGTLTATGAGVTVIKSEPGRILLDVKPMAGAATNGIQIKESSLDPSAPIRNIHVFLPGFSAEPKGNPFNPPFVALLRPFKVIRFIGWSHVSRSETTEWSDERPVTYATQASPVTVMQKMSGVSIEYEIILANLLHADPWFLVPLKANDDYVSRMAALVHKSLDPSLHPYVELSNEVWNMHFPEGAYARRRGVEAGLDIDPMLAGAKWYTGQALHVFDIWTGVFGADSARIVRVLGGAYPLPPITRAELAYKDAYKHVDAFAIAPYILPKFVNDYAAVAQATADQVLDHVQEDITVKLRNFMGYHLAYTKKYGVDLVAYEGGPGLMSAGAPPQLLPQIGRTLYQASHSSRMAALYRTLLDEWFSLGGTLFNHFDDCSPPNPWGDFGLVDYQYQDPATSQRFLMLSAYAKGRR